jgi:hypothetical protein
MSWHGIRAMASTLLNELGFAPDIIELQLAHQERNEVRAAYNRAQRTDERRKMMQTWADYLDGLRTGANVLPFRRTPVNPMAGAPRDNKKKRCLELTDPTIYVPEEQESIRGCPKEGL